MDEVTDALRRWTALPEDEAGAYHTIGGFVMARLGRVPKTADAFEWGGMRFEVIDMDGRRIDKVLVTRKQPSAGALVWRRGGDGQCEVRRVRAGSEDALSCRLKSSGCARKMFGTNF